MLHYYNYSHDSALACAPRYYNVPAIIRAMEHDLMPLAACVADADDVVAVGGDMVEPCRAFYRQLLDEPPSFCPDDSLPPGSVSPWGWDATVRKRIADGRRVDTAAVCSDDMLQAVHELSSRRHSAAMLKALRERLAGLPLCGERWWCGDMDELHRRLASLSAPQLLKMPYSSSGRGLRLWQGETDTALTGWCRNVMRSQGGLTVEPMYRRAMDFALEYEVTQHDVRYRGLSIFQTTANFAYTGSIVVPQEALLQRLSPHLSLTELERLADETGCQLSTLLPGRYEGPVGVDMMVCRDGANGGRTLIHPCVEINLRQTMGHLALSLAELLFGNGGKLSAKLPSGCREALFTVGMKTASAAATANPPTVIPLVPATAQSRFSAELTLLPQTSE